MAVVDVRVYTEQSLEDGAHYIHEVCWEWLTKLAREHSRIINLLTRRTQTAA